MPIEKQMQCSSNSLAIAGEGPTPGRASPSPCPGPTISWLRGTSVHQSVRSMKGLLRQRAHQFSNVSGKQSPLEPANARIRGGDHKSTAPKLRPRSRELPGVRVQSESARVVAAEEKSKSAPPP